jgi:hypothetical protein
MSSRIRRILPFASAPKALRGGAVVLALACAVAALVALAGHGAASADVPGADAGVKPDAGLAPAGADEEGLSDEATLKWMPPGTSASPLPSEAVFPPQAIGIRFSHRLHVKGLGQACKSCHPGAYSSDTSKDSLMPHPTLSCDRCHGVSHVDFRQVLSDASPRAACSFCHAAATTPLHRADGGVQATIAPSVFPRAHLIFSHAKHLARNIQCGQCHGHVEELDLATREQLPRMGGCLACHNLTGASRGDAKGACATCHPTQADGRLQMALGGAALLPPRWLGSAAHDADWIERHKAVAAEDSAFCANCHTDKECIDCHDGNVRPRSVHPNDWLSMHPQAARTDNPRCSSCHNEQSFCADCHRRLGIAQDTPSGNRPSGRRFHPPPEQWTYAPRGPEHHAWDAMRNLNACVSCHTERDCASCHATKGVMGGAGVNPHPANFRDKCGLALRQNPRPCLVCHPPGDGLFSSCR